jgi:DNA-binding transcriptional regulator YiaG
MNDADRTDETSLAPVRLPDRLPAPEQRREIRQRAGISGVALAAAIGVAPGSVYAWETSGREPKGLQRDAYVAALRQLAEAVIREGTGEWTTGS